MSANAGEISLHAYELKATDNFRFIFNFNIPVAVRDSLPLYRVCLARIRNFIVSHFYPRPENCHSCRFQVTATYILKREDIDDVTRIWTGSFNNSENEATILSGDIWQEFNAETFITFVETCTTPQRVLDVLDWDEIDTKWKFDRLLSIIVSFQVVVRLSNTRFHRSFGFGVSNGRGAYRHLVKIENW